MTDSEKLWHKRSATNKRDHCFSVLWSPDRLRGCWCHRIAGISSCLNSTAILPLSIPSPQRLSWLLKASILPVVAEGGWAETLICVFSVTAEKLVMDQKPLRLIQYQDGVNAPLTPPKTHTHIHKHSTLKIDLTTHFLPNASNTKTPRKPQKDTTSLERNVLI